MMLIKPEAYWDRVDNVPRSMADDHPMPDYEGLILKVTDVFGAQIMHTFFINGKRTFAVVPAVTEISLDS